MMTPLKNVGLCLDQICHCNVWFRFGGSGVTLACNWALSRMVSRVMSLVTEGLITSLLMHCLGVICHADRSSFSQLCRLIIGVKIVFTYKYKPCLKLRVFKCSSGQMSCLSHLDLITGWIRMKGRWESPPLPCDVTGGQIQYLIQHLSKNV